MHPLDSKSLEPFTSNALGPCTGTALYSVVIQSVSRAWLCNPMYCSPPGSPVLHLPRVCSDSCPLSQWCYPIISSSVNLFSFCLHSFPTSGSFPMSWFFTSGGWSIGASASVLPMNFQSWFPVGLTGLISLQSQSNDTSCSSCRKKKENFSARVCLVHSLCPNPSQVGSKWQSKTWGSLKFRPVSREGAAMSLLWTAPSSYIQLTPSPCLFALGLFLPAYVQNTL